MSRTCVGEAKGRRVGSTAALPEAAPRAAAASGGDHCGREREVAWCKAKDLISVRDGNFDSKNAINGKLPMNCLLTKL